MLVIPAIDLLDGNVVRLTKGKLSTAKIYSRDPVEVARNFKKDGAKLLHIVDLSAAFGRGDNIKVISEILDKVNIKVQVGGGIRSIEKAEKLVNLGVERIIVGTKSLDEKFLKILSSKISFKKIAVSVDVKNEKIAVCGWRKKTTLYFLDFIKKLQNVGIRWLIYTDILKDGTLSGINLKNIKKLADFKDLNIIVSGGISSLDDLTKIKNQAPFLRAVIIGKALYEGKFKLKDAIALLQNNCLKTKKC